MRQRGREKGGRKVIKDEEKTLKKKKKRERGNGYKRRQNIEKRKR